MMPNFAYSQFEGIDSKIEEAKRKAAERAKELKNPDTQRSRGNERERTYIPPIPEEKYEYDGVTYSTRKEMEAAKARAEAAKKKAKEENWRNNIKPGIDAGFRPINSANNSSGLRQFNSANNTGFREPGESSKIGKNVEQWGDKISDAAKVTTDPRVWKTVDDAANLTGKNVLLRPIDITGQEMNRIVTDAAQQKAGYARGSAEDKAVTLAVSDFTGFISGHVKQEVSNKYLSNNKNPRLLINQSPRQEANIWKENAAGYLGGRSKKAMDDAAWHGKNTPMTVSEYLEDLKLYADGKITKEEMNRREKERWYNYFQRVVKQALSL